MVVRSLEIVGILLIVTITIQRIQSAPSGIEDDIQRLVNLAIDGAAPSILETGLRVGNDDLDAGDRFASPVAVTDDLLFNMKTLLTDHFTENGTPFLTVPDTSSALKLLPKLMSDSTLSDSVQKLLAEVKSSQLLNAMVHPAPAPTAESSTSLKMPKQNEPVQENVASVASTNGPTSTTTAAESILEKASKSRSSVVKKDLSLVPYIQTGVFPELGLKLAGVSADEQISQFLQSPEMYSDSSADTQEREKLDRFLEGKMHTLALDTKRQLEQLPVKEHLMEEELKGLTELETLANLSQDKEKQQVIVTNSLQDNISIPLTPSTRSDKSVADAAPTTIALPTTTDQQRSRTGDSLMVQEVFPSADSNVKLTQESKAVDILRLPSSSSPHHEHGKLNADFTGDISDSDALHDGINLRNKHGNPFYFLLGPFKVAQNSLFSYLGQNNLGPISNLLHLNITNENDSPAAILQNWVLAKQQALSKLVFK